MGEEGEGGEGHTLKKLETSMMKEEALDLPWTAKMVSSTRDNRKKKAT